MASQTGLSDTSAEAAAVQNECYRRMTVSQRMELTRSLIRATFAQSVRAIEDAYPEMTARDRKLMLIELNYGRALAAAVRARMP
ncbi:hypothetical protein [Fuerstiella marisgermanici]|uniref:Uncharacterized protein n=1 Tax=Fuerstiella marisgermanici TaxID=1891926 RepID=A0A1P8WRW6_9PLAN|nr:hypothetical protein [Fuerstiella marisgermanici]APZ96806.1 hypothetical protein Fuma_06480 [Fuerstiella marisgermanici]